MMKKVKLTLLLVLGSFTLSPLTAQEQTTQNDFKRFYVKPYAGFIGIQDMDLQLIANNQTTNVNVESGFGFTSGIAVGYNFNNNISAELGWEYKSNNITLTNNGVQTKGDYASNFIYINGIYNFDTNSAFKPYLGLGASLIQEIDLDFGSGANSSFSDSGNLGVQALAGIDYNFSDRWALSAEAKYTSFSTFDMTSETNSNRLNNLKYNPFIVNVGIKYRF